MKLRSQRLVETKSPCPTLRWNRDNSGDGSAPHSLSRAGIWHSLFSGCRLPDAILRANGVRGLVAGPSEIFRLQISSEAFQLASAGGCAPGLRTRSRHVCDFGFASWPLLARVSHRFCRCVRPRHGSRLFTLRLLSFTGQRCRL